MRRHSFVVGIVTIAIVVVCTGIIVAQNGMLQYKEFPNTLKYKNQIKIANVTETNKVHLSTQMMLTCILENSVRKRDDQLVLWTRFTDFSLDEMRRELQIEGNELRDLSPRDLAFTSHVLKRHLYDKWIELTLTQDGIVLSRRHAEGLEEAEPIQFMRVADQFLITLPPGELQVGQRWEADYTATVALGEENQYTVSRAKYTYMGKVLEHGINCYKINVTYHLVEDESIQETEHGTSWATYAASGTIYLAVDGAYMVKSEIVTDLSFLMLLEATNDEGNFVNFIRSTIEQSIHLLPSIP